ncbi:MAG: alpha/beta fold hydrolase [Simkaniaceae bacterium]|nr:alpha/beta fold hydrolase [Simkaniaceae bacterium]
MISHELPRVSFRVQHSVIEKRLLNDKVRKIFTCLVFPIALFEYALKKALLPGRTSFSAAVLDSHRAYNLSRMTNATRTTVETIDKVKLDTVQIKHPTSQKWIIFLNPNNGVYENSLPYLYALSQQTGQNVYSGNYRGVGRSEGDITTIRDLLLDGESFIQDLLSKGVQPPEITLHGHSMGGGVATELAALYPGLNLVADRTYSSISDAITTLVTPQAGRCIASTAAKITTLLGWNLNPLAAFPKISGRKTTIHHKLCFLQPCGLYALLKKGGIRPPHYIKMRDEVHGDEIEAHCKDLMGPSLAAYVRFVNP